MHKEDKYDYRYYPLKHQGPVMLPRDVENALVYLDFVDIYTKSSNPNYIIQICRVNNVECPCLEELRYNVSPVR